MRQVILEEVEFDEDSEMVGSEEDNEMGILIKTTRWKSRIPTGS